MTTPSSFLHSSVAHHQISRFAKTILKNDGLVRMRDGKELDLRCRREEFYDALCASLSPAIHSVRFALMVEIQPLACTDRLAPCASN